jgi:prevent-host-death family protein
VARLTRGGHSWLDKAMRRVGIAQLKDNLSLHLRSVEAGEVVEVMDRARPIARIVPISPRRSVTIRPSKRPFAAVRDRRFPPLDLPVSSDELLREERREWVDRETPG